ncbi:MAG: hypothetical protein COT81_03375 [Candidatus Buchananbacteria bacterium CG10_big_fil_rev_8_21_14_0_10_42_9]|uniref:Uncharacterized protein n=1 Tax=Candidatus Buchananbacteria bacterium CG10_big_fil_rev_8_21_14_0_10_42_9 TaxID=1974526 RepID=A0A2H0W141_9BACT|nr:MAG: hypothetical protein COT81_03375 [Candidatus Buchananbacteria bacterium CG10_big_fil_rev_8_21_14_0_10_42_9]
MVTVQPALRVKLPSPVAKSPDAHMVQVLLQEGSDQTLQVRAAIDPGTTGMVDRICARRAEWFDGEAWQPYRYHRLVVVLPANNRRYVWTCAEGGYILHGRHGSLNGEVQVWIGRSRPVTPDTVCLTPI